MLSMIDASLIMPSFSVASATMHARSTRASVTRAARADSSAAVTSACSARSLTLSDGENDGRLTPKRAPPPARRRLPQSTIRSFVISSPKSTASSKCSPQAPRPSTRASPMRSKRRARLLRSLSTRTRSSRQVHHAGERTASVRRLDYI